MENFGGSLGLISGRPSGMVIWSQTGPREHQARSTAEFHPAVSHPYPTRACGVPHIDSGSFPGSRARIRFVYVCRHWESCGELDSQLRRPGARAGRSTPWQSLFILSHVVKLTAVYICSKQEWSWINQKLV